MQDGDGSSAAEFAGQAEVDAATRALATILRQAGESEAAADTFAAHLALSLRQRYENHWWTHAPTRGEGYRHVSCGQENIDPAVSQALKVANIPQFRLPRDMSLWCDPGSVTTRIGNGTPRTQCVGDVSGRWTPPVSPAQTQRSQPLSALSPEFKPSPPSSPPTQAARGHVRARDAQPYSMDMATGPATDAYGYSAAMSPPYGGDNRFAIHQRSTFFDQRGFQFGRNMMPLH